MLVEIIQEDTRDRLDRKLSADTGVSQEFLKTIEIVRGEDVVDQMTGQKKFEALKAKVPSNKGKIVKMGKGCFGEDFQRKYGTEHEYPAVGDIIMFVPNKSFQVDPENKFHIVDDNCVVGWYKDEVKV